MKAIKKLNKIDLIGFLVLTTIIIPLLITLVYEILIKGTILHY